MFFLITVSLSTQLQNGKYIQQNPNKEVYMKSPSIPEQNYDIPIQFSQNNIASNLNENSFASNRFGSPSNPLPLAHQPLENPDEIKFNTPAIPQKDLQKLISQSQLLKQEENAFKKPLTQKTQPLYGNTNEKTLQQHYQNPIVTRNSNQIVNQNLPNQIFDTGKFNFKRITKSI